MKRKSKREVIFCSLDDRTLLFDFAFTFGYVIMGGTSYQMIVQEYTSKTISSIIWKIFEDLQNNQIGIYKEGIWVEE